jgi:hypothetical protein
MTRDALFTCTPRWLYNAAQKKGDMSVYLMEYAFYSFKLLNVTAAIHGSDLLPTFWNSGLNPKEIANKFIYPRVKCINSRIPKLAVENFIAAVANKSRDYQKYLVGHAISGDPNHGHPSVTWDLPSVSGSELTDLLHVTANTPEFQNDYTDPLSLECICDFWAQMASDVTTGSTVDPSASICSVSSCPTSNAAAAGLVLQDQDRYLEGAWEL